MLFHLTPSAPSDGYGDALLPLEQAVQWLRVDGSDDDDLIEALRDASINMVEQYANLRMGPCSGIVAQFGGFERVIRLGIGPSWSIVVTEVSHVVGGETIVLSPAAWSFGAGGVLTAVPGTCWPSGSSEVRVTFDVGFPDGQCPSSLVHAAKMFLAHLYMNREAVSASGMAAELPLGFTTLCDRYRMPVL